MIFLTVDQPAASLIAARSNAVLTRGHPLRNRGRVAIESSDIAPQDDGVAGEPVGLPLAVVVASAMVTDCLPIVDLDDERDSGCVVLADGRAWIDHASHLELTDLSDRYVHGAVRPGRWAILLEDVASTTDRCPACWGSGSHPTFTRQVCRVCAGARGCDPFPPSGSRRDPTERTP